MSALWPRGWRAALPELLQREWDLLVIGGGITGAGILLEASRRGLRALLVEQRDFAWGTSSRSSKLVHGGLRYLAQGHVRLTREAVREREALLRDAPGLVEPQRFAFPDYGASRRKRRTMLAGLALYDLFAGRRERHWIDAHEFALLAPNVMRADLAGGMVYTDAKTDDARLVIDASGAWAGKLSANGPRLRPLRGSHLVLPAWRLPLAQAVSLMHPVDGRPVFAFPWEGATLVGTTDVDHREGLANEAAITRAELDYLLAALRAQFPQLDLGEADVLATYAGVRPVVDSGPGDAPSKAGREHAVWCGAGLVGVAGGKLTTFRAIALDVLRQAQRQLPGWQDDLAPVPVYEQVALPRAPRRVPAPLLRRLAGRHGAQAQALVDAAGADELEAIPGTETLWAELRWAARAEGVEQLDDLLLRRTRIGLLLRGGGLQHAERIRAICQMELGWEDARWDHEQAAYAALIARHYGLPGQERP